MARFVLVHGAFGGAWCWQPVVAALEADGHTADAPDLPGGGDDRTPVEDITLEACADRVRETLDSAPGDSVLVAHSMGGVVATQAAGSDPAGISSLVFVAAFMPANGQSLLDLTRLPEGANDMIQASIVVEGDPPMANLADDAAAAAIYHRCTEEQRAWALPQRRPQAVAAFATPVSIDEDALAAIPRSYVLTRQDRSIPPALQRRMISEHPCRRVIELDTDHAPYLSATRELAAALVELSAGS